VRQPPIAHHADAQAHRIDRAPVLTLHRQVDRALHDDRAGRGVVGRGVTADPSMDVAADEDPRGVQIGGPQQDVVGLRLDRGSPLGEFALDRRVVGAGRGADLLDLRAHHAQQQGQLIEHGLELIGNVEDDLHRGAFGRADGVVTRVCTKVPALSTHARPRRSQRAVSMRGRPEAALESNVPWPAPRPRMRLPGFRSVWSSRPRAPALAFRDGARIRCARRPNEKGML